MKCADCGGAHSVACGDCEVRTKAVEVQQLRVNMDILLVHNLFLLSPSGHISYIHIYEVSNKHMWLFPSGFLQCFLVFPVLPCLYLFLFVCVCLWVWSSLPRSPGPLLSPSNTPALQSSHSPHLSFPAHSLTCFHFPQSATHTYIQTQILCPLPDHQGCLGLGMFLWTHLLCFLEYF